MVGYSPWDRKESDTTEQLHFHFLSLVNKKLDDETRPGAAGRAAAVRRDVPGGPRGRVHHPAGWLGTCLQVVVVVLNFFFKEKKLSLSWLFLTA